MEGAQILEYTPPQSETGGHGPVLMYLFLLILLNLWQLFTLVSYDNGNKVIRNKLLFV
jgi:hypothetical protein